MPTIDLQQLTKQLGEVARRAAMTLLDHYDKTMITRKKADNSIVTEADLAAEKVILEGLTAIDPSCPVLSEESSPEIIKRPRQFIVDPLDGTSNFSTGFPWYSVSIAYEEKGELAAAAIHIPPRDELILAAKGCGATCNGKALRVSTTSKFEDAMLAVGFYYTKDEILQKEVTRFRQVQQLVKGVRRPGSAVIDLVSVARGWFDGFWELGLNPWDLAAGCLIVKEAGGTITDYSGRLHSIYGKTTVASNGALHEQLLSRIKLPGE